jgi:hypothetical protein
MNAPLRAARLPVCIALWCACVVGAVSRPVAAFQLDIDYRYRSLNNSRTSYEYGTLDLPPEGWAPLSRLVFSLDSAWHGLRLGLDRPEWEVHAEWLMPVRDAVDGALLDYDWLPPNSDASYTDLGTMRERWISGQMLGFGLDVRLLETLFGQPIEFWPMGGFRWQRFHLLTYDLVQVTENNVLMADPYAYAGDVIDFTQDYNSPYIGFELRTLLSFWSLLPTRLTLGFDGGYVVAQNTDHHLLREGDRYTFDETSGSAIHIGFTAEVPLGSHLSLGLELDHLEMHTSGTHRLLNAPLGIDETSDHGVHVWSDQSWLTFFACFRI